MTVKLSRTQLGMVALSGIECAEIGTGARAGNSHKGLARQGFGETYPVAITGLRDRYGNPKTIHVTKYRNNERGAALVCATCHGRGGMDAIRPHIRDCEDCEGIGAHQP